MTCEENYFYSPQIPGSAFEMSEEESRHAAAVLRLKKNDRLLLTDGKGTLAECEIIKVSANRVAVKPLAMRNATPEIPEITLAAGMTKKTAFERLAGLVSQLPVKEIIPFESDHAVLEKSSYVKSLDRFQKISLASMKQSKRVFLTAINKPGTFADILDLRSLYEYAFIFEKLDAEQHKPDAAALKKARAVLIITGPEGGFSREEISAAHKNNIEVLSLGRTRLRAEAAGFAAIVSILTLTGAML